MKITVNKDYTTIAQIDQVKADVKEFKARYTEGDLKRAFFDAVDIHPANSSDVILCRGDAFPGGYEYNNETHFSMEMLLTNNIDCLLGFCRIHFFCDMDLNIDAREYPINMYTIDVFDRRA